MSGEVYSRLRSLASPILEYGQRLWFRHQPGVLRRCLSGLLLIALPYLISCTRQPAISFSPTSAARLGNDPLTGDIKPVHDPSIIRQGSNWYIFSTDVMDLPPANFLPVRCSQNRIAWRACGHIFDRIPAWVLAKVPGIDRLWAPDVSYFNGLYHVYYAGSTFSSQQSVIGLATNVTLDPKDPRYKWVDQGEVLGSHPGDDFNAIDPNILVDKDGRVWLTYGSYWSGIKQREIDPRTGLLLASNPRRYNLAARPDVPVHPIEGASLVRHGGYYYLFVSIDYCCNHNIWTDNYKEAVGRSTGPHGPFVDERGTPMLKGGGTVVLQGDGRQWGGPGGGTAYVDPRGDSLFVFHALNMRQNGALYLWIKTIEWKDGWPVLAAG